MRPQLKWRFIFSPVFIYIVLGSRKLKGLAKGLACASLNWIWEEEQVVNSLRFNSVILMLNEEDRGFGKDKPPAGYVRLEVREGKGRLSAMVQDLKDSDEYNNYKLYLIRYHEGEICPACMGTIPVKNGRGEITGEFDPLNVEDTKLQINDFNIAAVILERKDAERIVIKCPLVVYKGKKIKWTEAFSNYTQNLTEILKTERKIKIGEEIKTGEVKEKEQENLEGKIEEKTGEKPEMKREEVIETETEEKTRQETESKYSYNENIPGVVSDANCRYCTRQSPDIELLVNCLDKVFKRCDPFNTKRQDYKWWKVSSPVHLSNVLYYCNIQIPKIFNPLIIMAYYKYRYLIAGIYTSRKKGKEYIVYGIPGTYNVDESPLGDLCRWIQVEGNTPKYGAFGYWIAYIDPATGEFLKVNH